MNALVDWAWNTNLLTYLPQDERTGWLGVKHQFTYLPQDERTGWLGVKHQFIYLLTYPRMNALVNWA